MEQLRAALQQADDDYLVGLSNKGIWKRAYKDLEGETPSLAWQGEDAQVTLNSETCVIKNPLGESTCSCPSSGICRHVVTAILWLKGQIGEDGQKGQENQGGEDSQTEQSPGESAVNWSAQEAQNLQMNSDRLVVQGGPTVQDSLTTSTAQGTSTAQENTATQGNQSGTQTQKLSEPSAGESAVGKSSVPREEFLSVPIDRLKRACGNRRYQTFLSRIKTGELPQLMETSIVTVTIPWEQTTVRLLSPLEHSTCTCHSKELCGHKAQALLLYQLKYGKLHLKDLEVLEAEESSIDMELAKEAADKVREHLLAQFEMGLSRQSLEVEESLERLAIICHRAQLANFENRLREAASDYRLYFQRSASFRVEELFRKLLALYELTGRVLEAEAPAELSALAGSFRSDYELVGRLQLMGMGARSFSSKTGYEGEIYYFLETGQKKWYTWTDARPVFYEGTRRRPGSAAGQAPAPWGLTCSREQMSEMEFELRDAKAASGERLSSSQDTKSEIIGPRNLELPQIQELVYDDYELLLHDYFGPKQNHGSDTEAGSDYFSGYNSSDVGEDGGGVSVSSYGDGTDDTGNGSGAADGGRSRRERLVLVRAFHWEEPVFDSVSQQFSWGLQDKKGRTLSISLRYTKTERYTINLLERLEQRLRRREEKILLFLGAVYLENGRLCLYPIEFYRQGKRNSVESQTAEENPVSWENQGAEEMQATSEGEASGKGQVIEKDRESEESIAAGISRQNSGSEILKIPNAVFETMEQYRQEAARTLSDLLVSGLSSVQEEVLSAMSLLAEDGRRLGLTFAGDEFFAIKEMLDNRRHQTDFQPEPVMDVMTRLTRYLLVCRQKLSYDMARLAMEPEEDSGTDGDKELDEDIDSGQI